MRAENCSDLAKSLNYLATDISVGAFLLQVWFSYPLHPLSIRENKVCFKEEETNMILSLFNVFNIYNVFNIFFKFASDRYLILGRYNQYSKWYWKEFNRNINVNSSI